MRSKRHTSVSLSALFACLLTSTAGAQTITSLNPDHGPCAGAPLTIVGTGLTGATSVVVGGNFATILELADTMVLVTTPQDSGLGKSVTVFVGATPSNSLNYNYDAPRISTIAPRNGPTVGGTSVTISGENFLGLGSVTVGAIPASVVFSSNTAITITTPAGSGISRDVVVNAGGQTSNAYPFNYEGPTITNISPPNGPTIGGTLVTISGTNLLGATSVLLGTAVMPIQLVSQTQVRALTPVGEGLFKQITVTTPGGTAVSGNTFSYNGPIISSVNPTHGPTVGATSMTINGSNLGIGNPITIHIGDQLATVTSQPPGGMQVVVSTPVGYGVNLPISLTTLSGTAIAASTFSYDGPSIASLSAIQGRPTVGGTPLTINGSNLPGPTQVTVGGNPATIFTSSHTQIFAASPAGYGARDVRVYTPSGFSNTLTYTYDAPFIFDISPGDGPCTGGTLVTLSGGNMLGVDRVTVGGVDGFVVAANHDFVAFETPPGIGVDLPVQAFTGMQLSNTVNFSYTGGACCVHTVGCGVDQCIIETQAECDARVNGTFLGVGTPCPGSCTVNVACCLPTGACLAITTGDCTALGGTAGEPDSTCAAANCQRTCSCPGDMNLDFLLDGGDIDSFVQALLNGQPCP